MRGDNWVAVVYGKNGTEYAIVQEKKQFKNYTTPGTGPPFLENAGDSVAKEGIRKFMGKG